MELFWNAVCFCRFQWLSVVGALSEKSGMELEENVGDWHSDVCSRLCGDILRFQAYNRIAGIYG